MIGKLLNERYRVDALLGEGGMGVVYQAHDTLIERDVAVKVISGTELGTQGRNRLLAEARLAGKLNHPNIVAVHDAGEVDDVPFIVMELVQGRNLCDVQDLPLGEKLRLSEQICQALANAHAHGIIHRDLKPENIMVTPQGDARLMDFGLARRLDDPRLTAEGSIMGTFLYMAPEIALGQEASPQSDLYALGVILYELFTGRTPFSADDLLALISQHLHAPVVPPARLNPEIPETLSALILQLLAKTPESRLDSAETVREKLLAVTAAALDSQPAPLDTGPSPAVAASGRLALLDRMVRGRLFGRKAELAELRSFWDRAARGEGHMVLLSGEPGVGKSRLARELAVYARLNGAQVLEGGFQPEMDVSYLALREALRGYLRTQDPENLKSLLAPYVPELVKLLPEVCEVVGEVVPNPVLENLKEERLRLFDHLTRFLLEIAAQQPLLLILEDLHWADAPSLQFIHHLLRNNAQSNLLAVGTYREVELDPARPFYEKLLGLNRERLYTRIALRRLDKNPTCKLVNTLLGGEVEGELAEKIAFETDGNPFYVEEVVKSLVSRSTIEEVDGVWVPVPGADIQVPQSLQIAIGKRVFSLPEDARDALHLAAVSGHTFSVDVLLEMTGWDEDRLLDILDTTEHAQLIRETTGDSLYDYAFEHALIAQVLYEGISQRRRARYHERTAKAMEAVYAHRLGDVVEPLAHHYALAPSRSAAKAVEYGLQAARKATEVYAHEQAAQHYQTVLDAYEDLNDPAGKAAAWEILGDTWDKLGDGAKTLEAYEAAVQALEDTGQVETRVYCQVAYKFAEELSTVQKEQSRLILEHLLINPALSPDDPLRPAVMSSLALKKLNEGELDEALALGEQALALAENSGDQTTIGRALTKLGLIHRARQESEGYEQAMQQLTRILEDAEDYAGLFDTFYDGIVYHFFKGNMEKADQLAAAGLSFCQRCNTPGWQGTILAIYLYSVGVRGHYREALQLGERMLPLYRRVGVSGCFLYVLIYLVMVNSRLGEIEQAEAHAESLLNLFLQFEGASTDSDVYLIWKILINSFLGRWEAAWAFLQEAIDRQVYPRPMTNSATVFLNTFAPEAAARNGHFAFAEDKARALLEDARAAQLTPGTALGLFDLGLALAGLGRQDESFSTFQEALSLFKDFEWPWETGQTLQEMARVLIARGEPGDRDKAHAYLQEAHEIFDSISARPMREQAEALLAAL